MFELIHSPWLWYVTGPLIGLMIPLLLLLGNKQFGVSSTMRDICAYCLPTKIKFFKYNLKEQHWNLAFILGIILGGLLAMFFMNNSQPVQLAEATISSLTQLGLHDFTGLIPSELFNLNAILSVQGFSAMIMGGFLVGFGARYAGGCTSGHAIMGLSQLSLGSLAAVIGFFVGGLIMTHFIFPIIF